MSKWLSIYDIDAKVTEWFREDTIDRIAIEKRPEYETIWKLWLYVGKEELLFMIDTKQKDALIKRLQMMG